MSVPKKRAPKKPLARATLTSVDERLARVEVLLHESIWLQVENVCHKADVSAGIRAALADANPRAAKPTPKQMAARRRFLDEMLASNEPPSTEAVEAMWRSWRAT